MREGGILRLKVDLLGRRECLGLAEVEMEMENENDRISRFGLE